MLSKHRADMEAKKIMLAITAENLGARRYFEVMKYASALGFNWEWSPMILVTDGWRKNERSGDETVVVSIDALVRLMMNFAE